MSDDKTAFDPFDRLGVNLIDRRFDPCRAWSCQDVNTTPLLVAFSARLMAHCWRRRLAGLPSVGMFPSVWNGPLMDFVIQVSSLVHLPHLSIMGYIERCGEGYDIAQHKHMFVDKKGVFRTYECKDITPDALQMENWGRTSDWPHIARWFAHDWPDVAADMGLVIGRRKKAGKRGHPKSGIVSHIIDKQLYVNVKSQKDWRNLRMALVPRFGEDLPEAESLRKMVQRTLKK